MILIVLWDGRPARPVYFMLWDGRPARPVYFMLWDGRPARPVYFPGRRDAYPTRFRAGGTPTPQDSGQAGRLPHKTHPQIVQRFSQIK